MSLILMISGSFRYFSFWLPIVKIFSYKLRKIFRAIILKLINKIFNTHIPLYFSNEYVQKKNRLLCVIYSSIRLFKLILKMLIMLIEKKNSSKWEYRFKNFKPLINYFTLIIFQIDITQRTCNITLLYQEESINSISEMRKNEPSLGRAN